MKAPRALLLCLPLVLAAVLTVSGWARPARAIGAAVEEAAAALGRDHVFVHPGAEPGLSDADADRLRQDILRSEAGPVYVALLPEEARHEAGGSVDALLQALAEMVGRPGTYAVVVGTQFRAGSSTLPSGAVASIANDAVARNRGQGPAGVLSTFVRGLGEAARSGQEVAPEGVAGPVGGPGDVDAGRGPGLVALVLAVGAVGLLLLSLRHRRQAKRRRQREIEEVRRAALEDLIALGEDLRALDLDVEMPNAPHEAKSHYERALGCYERATSSLDRAQRPEDLRAVSETLDEGRYEIACVRARLEGLEPPERRPPCFFDPRHGQSVRDVWWAPLGGIARSVPACEADAQRVERGEEPLARDVGVGSRRMPYWEAPYHYGPWAAGYFGGSGFLEGLVLGSLFSSSAEDAAGHHHEHEPELDGVFGIGDHRLDDVGGGDFGSGDFGGGHFGGGDFGGGDFGGGDFGGGDFG